MQKFEGVKPHPVLIEGFILGAYCQVDDKVDLDCRQAVEFRREGRVGPPEGSASKSVAKPVKAKT